MDGATFTTVLLGTVVTKVVDLVRQLDTRDAWQSWCGLFYRCSWGWALP